MSGRRYRKRVWTPAHSEKAVALLHRFRTDLLVLNTDAPFSSDEYKAITALMLGTADAMRVFGFDVYSTTPRPRPDA